MLSCGCGTPFRNEDIDLSLGVVHCASCGEVSELRARPAAPPAAKMTAAPEGIPLTAAVPMAPPRPGSWSEEGSGHGDLVLTHRWMGLQAVFLLFFTLFWNGIVGLMVTGAVAQEGLEGLWILAMPHVWVGLGLGYYVAATLVNRTEVRLGEGQLTVWHGPLPWWGQRSFGVEQVGQLYVEESGVRVNKQPRWNLAMMDRDQTGHVLVRMLSSPGEARYLEHRLEEAMGIENRPVFGEVPR